MEISLAALILSVLAKICCTGCIPRPEAGQPDEVTQESLQGQEPAVITTVTVNYQADDESDNPCVSPEKVVRKIHKKKKKGTNG